MDALTWAGSLAAKSIASSLIEEAKYLYGIEDHVRGLERELTLIVHYLEDVDANPHRAGQDDGQIRIFTEKIRELAFRAEDAIDTYLARAINMRKNLCLRFVCSALPTSPDRRLIKEIEDIRQEIEDAKTRFQSYAVVESRPGGTSSQSQGLSSQPVPENYRNNEVVLVGISEDIYELVQRLTCPEDDFNVLGIVGVGGAGKTTLASMLYHHNQVARCFLYKAYVSVSQNWTGIGLLRQIFRQVNGGDWIPSTEIELAQELYYFLKDKQCLIVVDDIWHKEAWDAIYPALPRTKGSRFILTTRNQELPLYADAKCIIHRLKPLHDEQWVLFRKLAMEGRDHIEANAAEFERLGKQLLETCQGSPLAVVALANILRTKPELYQWVEINKAIGDYMLQGMADPKSVKGILELSYLDLPTYLKPCFLYLAIIPEDHDIPAQMLTKMWIAEGFITSDLQKNNEILEDVAMQLLEELVRRSCLQVTSKSVRGHIEQCSLHDLIRDLSIFKSKEQCFFETVTSENRVRSPSQPRRISIFSRECVLEENHHLRTLVQFDRAYGNELLNPGGAIKNLESIEKKFKLLKVLNIWGVEHVVLPKHIGNLVLLRYLGINATRISELPKSVRHLRNLLYIDLLSPGDLEAEDPIHLLSNMKNLRGVALPHLIRGSFSSLGLTRSRNLQSLTSGAGTWMMEELPRVSPTVKNLEIFGIEEMEEIEAIYQCPGVTEGGLCTLKCDYKASGLEFDLQKLMQCTTLWSLELNGLLKDRWEGAIRFPPKLEKLSLSGSRIEEWPDLMQLLGDLPSLKYLSLSYGAYLGMQLHCTDGAFPWLQELHLSRLYNLEEWRMEEGALSRLSKMEIEHCPKLKKLPESIRSIITLEELQISSMPEEFCKRLGYGEEDSYIIQHIPSLKITTGLL